VLDLLITREELILVGLENGSLTNVMGDEISFN
jgi:hypothetical protein